MYEKILDISKRRGIVYPSFEIYGGLSGFYDYGPIGSRIKENLENLLREYYVIDEGCFEVQCPTLSPEDVWIASGHVKSFSDFSIECTKCGEAYRADHLIEAHAKVKTEGLSSEKLQELIEKNKISCPKCKSKLSSLSSYNLMFGTVVGAGKDKKTAYLRPETAQTTYLAFKRLWEIARKKLPFGVIQIGHSFRNEISPRQGMIRLREFNQAEVQFFVDPESKKAERFSEVSGLKLRMVTKDEKEIETTLGDAVDKKFIKNELMAYHLGKAFKLFVVMGINPNALKLRQHKDDERAFYSKDTWDVEFESKNFGRVELVGIADRSDYDLTQHQKHSRESMEVNLEGRKFIPHVVEVAYGIDRPLYCVVESCYVEEAERTYFKFPKKIAPYIAAVFPLVQKDGLPEKAMEIFSTLKEKRIYVLYDGSGSIGKRYARADEIGIPYAITIDYDTLKDNTVTIRDRNSKGQKRVKIDELFPEISA